MHKKVKLHSLTAGDPLLVELSEELRGKLMEIWGRVEVESASNDPDPDIEGFVDAITTRINR